MDKTIVKLNKFSWQISRNALVMIFFAGSGHPGGSLSCADLLSYLFINEVSSFSTGLDTFGDNRFVLSKGHACPALYAAMVGKNIISHDSVFELRKLGSTLQGHPCSCSLPSVETSTGSLGQGFSVAIGMAIGLHHKKQESNVYVLMGDGEVQEGEVWEGAMCAGHYKLDNLCGIIDYNKMQSDDLNENIMGLEPLRAKWEAFNWHVIEIDGHNFVEIDKAFNEAKSIKEKPTMIIAHTVKGKGVSYMENSPLWHGSVKLTEEDLVQALRDLDTPEAEIRGYLDGTVWTGK
jgi:transketolase